MTTTAPDNLPPARGGSPAARGEPDARSAAASRLGLVIGGSIRHAGPGDPRGHRGVGRAGGDPRPEIMVPLVGASRTGEHRGGDRPRRQRGLGRDRCRPAAQRWHGSRASAGSPPRRPDIEAAEFFSFGTKHLTHSRGASRDDVEAAFFALPGDLRATCCLSRSGHRGKWLMHHHRCRRQGRAGPVRLCWRVR